LSFPISAALLDACVLAQLSTKDSYGYEVTQELSSRLRVSESTIYPVLRRLQTTGQLSTYDQPFQGRMRRYYSLSDQGAVQLENYRADWKQFSSNINKILEKEK